MKTPVHLFKLTFAILVLSTVIVSICHAEAKENNVFNRTQIRIKKLDFEAANIYEAIHHTMSLAIEQDASLKGITIVIGPMEPRSKEKPSKMKLENETLWNMLRYWAELFQLRLTYKDQCLIFDENWKD